MDEVTLSLGALLAFASIIANAVALREGVKRNRERHDKRDQQDGEFRRAIELMEQRWRDQDTEARVRGELQTPIDSAQTKEWSR